MKNIIKMRIIHDISSNPIKEYILEFFKYIGLMVHDEIIDNEYGAKIAEELLTKENYSKDKINLITKCILDHSSKRKEYRTTLEENILVDADAMAHFDCIESLYSLANKVMGLNETESIKFVQEKLTKDYEEISSDVKYMIENKYNKIMSCKTLNDLEKIIERRNKKNTYID